MATTATTTTVFTASSSHLLHRHGPARAPHTTTPVQQPPSPSTSVPPPAPSPFDLLGPDLVRAILSHVAGESLDRPITTDAYRFVLPFAAACRSHYAVVARAVVGLSLLPLNFTLDRTGHRRRPPPFPPALRLQSSSASSSSPSPSPAQQQLQLQAGSILPSFPASPPPPPQPPSSLGSPHASAAALCALAPTAPTALDRHLPAAVAHLPSLRVLHLFRNSQVCDGALESIAQSAPNLTELRLRANRSLTVVGVRALQHCKALSILDLSYCLGLSDECGDALARLPALHTLLLAYWPVSDAFVATLAASPSLRDLCLTACSALTPLACKHLADANRLVALRFRSSPTLDDRAVAHLARIQSLTTLDVALSRHVSDGALRALGDSARAPCAGAVVDDVDMRDCDADADADADAESYESESYASDDDRMAVDNDGPCADADEPAATPGLLDMTAASGAATRRAHRDAATRLTRLTLSQCAQITDAGVVALCRNPHIRVLDLSFCHHVTDGGVDALTRLPRLESVDLSGCRNVSDRAVARLARLPWLCRVGLSRCTALTDGAAAALCAAANRPLELVDVRNCFAIGADALDELAAACVQLLRSPER